MKKYDIVIITGPSCVGKTPLVKALKRYHPALAKTLCPVILYNSRAPRPGEEDGQDYHFRSRDKIEQLRDKNDFIVLDVRGDLQAINVNEVHDMAQSSRPFFEGNPLIAKKLLKDTRLPDDCLSIFISPLCLEELKILKDSHTNFSNTITNIMRRKLLRRTQSQKGLLSAPDLSNIEIRAQSAVSELREAYHFQYVIPNHDGEDSENWNTFGHLLGDARKTLIAFKALLALETPPDWVETWDNSLFKS